MDNNLQHGGNGGGAGGEGGGVPSSPSSGGGGGGGGDRFSHDISQMSELPAKNLLGHRRAHSEILSLPDDLSFDSDLGVVGGGLGGDGNGGGGPSLSDEADEDFVSMYMDMEKFGPSSSSDTSGAVAGEPSSSSFLPPQVGGEPSSADGVNNRPRIRHHHSQSMDGSSSIKPELLMSEGPSLCQDNRRVSSAKLAELALVDPKRAKRIWQNRQSAARSKERKMRYISELERKLQTLQTEATTLSTQLNMLQRNRSGLTSENNELKVRLHNIEQKLHLQDALNEALKDEVRRLKLMTGQTIVGSMPMHASSQPFYPNNNHVGMNSLLAAHQFQQLQLQQHHQQQMSAMDMKLKGGPISLQYNRETNSSDKNNSLNVNNV